METNLATQILGLVVVFLKTQMSLAFEEEIRKEAVERIKPYAKNVYDMVRKATQGDIDATQTLNKLEADPQNRELQAYLEKYLQEIIKTNNDFKKITEDLLYEIKKNERGDIYNFINGNQIINNKEVEQDKDSCLPFSVTSKKEAQDLIVGELLEGNYTPIDILENSQIRTENIFLPTYIVNGTFTSTFEYTITKTINETTTSETIPVAIGDRTFNEIIVATNISKSLSLSKNHDTNGLLNFVEDEISFFDHEIETLNCSALEQVIKPTYSIKKDKAKKNIKDRLHSKVKKEMMKELNLDFYNKPKLYPLNMQWDTFRKVYLPFWFLVYYYNNNEYLVVMRGYGDNQFYAEKKPKDNNRLMEDAIDILKYVFPLFAIIVVACLGIYHFIDESLINDNLRDISIVSIFLLLCVSAIPFKHTIDRINNSKEIRSQKYDDYCEGKLKLNEIDFFR